MSGGRKRRRETADVQEEKKRRQHSTSSTTNLHEIHPSKNDADSPDKGNPLEVAGYSSILKQLKKDPRSQSPLLNHSLFRSNERERPRRRKTNPSLQSALPLSPTSDLSDDEEEIVRLKEPQRKTLGEKIHKKSRDTVSKRRKNLSLAEKVEVLAFAENFSERETAIAFEISKTAVNMIKNCKQEIVTLYEASKGSRETRCRRIRKTRFEDVNIKTWKWFLERLEMQERVTNKELREKALSFARMDGVKNFAASNGWIDSFKERFGITLSRSEVSVKNPKSVCAYLEAKTGPKKENEQPRLSAANRSCVRTPVHFQKNILMAAVPSVEVKGFEELLL